MNSDEASQNYNGEVPDEYRKTFIHGSYEAYTKAFARTVERHFQQRFKDILRSLCVWRQHAEYPAEIKLKMLDYLSSVLFNARKSAITAFDCLGA